MKAIVLADPIQKMLVEGLDYVNCFLLTML